MNALTTFSNRSVSTAQSWGLLPPLGNLDAYISAVQNMPMLSAEEEQQLARDLRDTGNLEAASRLVLSHLRPGAYSLLAAPAALAHQLGS